MDRRFFMKSSGVALASFAMTPSFLIRTALAQGTTRKEHRRPIVVAVFQRGAADGISMVVPYGDPHYRVLRPQIAIASPIDLNGFFGLHPSLDSLKSLYDAGNLAIVHAVGSPDNTRSHFDAQDYMESAAPGNKSVSDGWMNRYLQVQPNADSTPFRAVAFSPNMPRSLMGPAPAVAMTRINDFDMRAGGASDAFTTAFEAMYGSEVTGRETFEALNILKKANPQQYSVANGASYPNAPFGRALLQIAQLIKAEVGLEVAFADIGGWDTHANQGNERGQLSNRLREFGDSLAAFCRDLGDRMEDVVVVTMTEFGRAIRQNGSGGTDHGHASALFVLGGPVKGRQVLGKWPGLATDQLYEGRDLALTTDFRQVFSEILAKHMDTTDVAHVFPGFKPGVPLNFI